jgi:hypothetical protein
MEFIVIILASLITYGTILSLICYIFNQKGTDFAVFWTVWKLGFFGKSTIILSYIVGIIPGLPLLWGNLSMWKTAWEICEDMWSNKENILKCYEALVLLLMISTILTALGTIH